MKRRSRWRSEFWIHVLFWILFLADRSYTVYRYYLSDYGYGTALIVNLTDVAIIALLFYVNYAWLVPRFLRRGAYPVYGVAALCLVALTFGLQYWYAIFISELLVDCETYLRSFEASMPYYVFQDLFYVLVSTGARFTSDWFRDRKLRSELEGYKTSAELAMLKHQISPHFLHNTLHNINYLVQAAPKQASEAIVKLSGLMRYMLHAVKLDFVDLRDEFVYLRQFIELQSIRLSKPEIVSFAAPDCNDAVMLRHKIRPLLLISFVENAFKHGDVSSEDAQIDIKAAVHDNVLEFEVFNRVGPRTKEATTGIGIENVSRRLELLYPDKHSLTISATASEFRILLRLEL